MPSVQRLEANHKPSREIQDPVSVRQLFNRYQNFEELTYGQTVMIEHLTSPQERVLFNDKHNTEVNRMWVKLGPGRREYWGPLVSKFTTFRPDVIRLSRLKNRDTFIDVGAGMTMADQVVALGLTGVKYFAFDQSDDARNAALPVLKRLVEGGHLGDAEYLHHDFNSGTMPELPVKDEGERVAASVFALSYGAADIMLGVVSDALYKARCDRFLMVCLNPEHFNAPEMLKEMLKNAEAMSPEQQRALAPLIANLRKGSPGYIWMNDFADFCIRDNAVRSLPDMVSYLSQVGNVEQPVLFGSGTGQSVGLMVSPFDK